VEALQVAAGDLEVAGLGRPHGEYDGVVPLGQLRTGELITDLDAGPKTVPPRRIWSRRRSRGFFSLLNSGIP